ncbi:hypothetical protein PKOR_01560 [Pontibacter korlensis]|uniref:Uncharacterized protein n=1 Tax=Pontibacter korlensis TaxID=400092 RepID=A0A0E3ZBV9_9BACT|nr:hypothetical protein PKOR_01560 [Pontibacter korlensis]
MCYRQTGKTIILKLVLLVLAEFALVKVPMNVVKYLIISVDIVVVEWKVAVRQLEREVKYQ